MELISVYQKTMLSAALMIVFSVHLVNGQINTPGPCTTSMISSFTPCANYITGSTNNGATPSTTCCDSLRSLMSTSMDCACLVISANAPILPLPISQALALSLSRACNINGVSAQCKAHGSRLPSPGPAALGSNSLPLHLPQAHELQVAVGPAEAEEPTRTPGMGPLLTPPFSASHPSFLSFSPFPLILIPLIVFGMPPIN